MVISRKQNKSYQKSVAGKTSSHQILLMIKKDIIDDSFFNSNLPLWMCSKFRSHFRENSSKENSLLLNSSQFIQFSPFFWQMATTRFKVSDYSLFFIFPELTRESGWSKWKVESNIPACCHLSHFPECTLTSQNWTENLWNCLRKKLFEIISSAQIFLRDQFFRPPVKYPPLRREQ